MPHTYRVQGLKIVTESTFGVDNSTAGVKRDVQATTADFAPNEASLEDGSLVQRYWRSRKNIRGQRRPTLNIANYLRGPGKALDGTVYSGSPPTTPQYGWGRVLESAFGGFLTNEGSLVATSTSASQFDVTAADGANFSVGSAVAAEATAGSGILQMMEIASISTDTINLKVPLGFTPAASANIYNVQSYYLKKYQTTDPTYQYVLAAEDSDNIWWMFGTKTNIAFDLTAGELVGVTASVVGADYEQDDSVATPLNAIALESTDVDEVGGDPIPFNNGIVQLVDVSGAAPFTRTVLDVSSLSFSLEWELLPQPSPSGVQGIKRWIPMPAAITGEITIPFEDVSQYTLWENRTAVAIYAQIGNTAGNCALFSLHGQVVSITPTNVDGIHSLTIGVRGTWDQTTPGNDGIQPSPFKLHLA